MAFRFSDEIHTGIDTSHEDLTKIIDLSPNTLPEVRNSFYGNKIDAPLP